MPSEELLGFLEESRDEYQDLYDEARENDDPFQQYSKGRYHAYCDVLAWLYSRDRDNMGAANE